MTKLTAKARKALPDSDFAIPSERKFPLNDASHAANAKARATQGIIAGQLTPAQGAKIKAAANKKLKAK
jgi:hypothetical protein